jgi:hypothetical protein
VGQPLIPTYYLGEKVGPKLAGDNRSPVLEFAMLRSYHVGVTLLNLEKGQLRLGGELETGIEWPERSTTCSYYPDQL